MSIVPAYSRRFSGIDPTLIPNCAIWLDGSDSSKITTSGTSVTQWSDKSGNSRHATATSGRVTAGQLTNMPTYTAGTNYIQFTANNTATVNQTSGWAYFDCPGLTALGGTQGFTLFIVMRRDSSKNGAFFTGGTSTTNGQRLHCGYFLSGTQDVLTHRYWGIAGLDVNASNFATGEPIKILRFRHTAANVRTIAINGYVVATDTPSSFLSVTSPNTCIGARDPYTAASSFVNNGFNGRLYEFLGYNRPVTDSESAQIESYLAWKYGILQDSTAGFGSFLPTSISSCALWLDAADQSTLFQDRAATTSITASGQNVRRWNNKGTAGSFAQDLVGTNNVFPKYQFGGVYIFNQNSNNYSATNLCSMAIQTNFQTTGDYSVIAVIDFANIGAGAYLQTIYSNNRALNRRAPQLGSPDTFESNTAGTLRSIGTTTFIGTGRRVIEFISTDASSLYFNQGAVVAAFTGGALASRYTTDADSFPMIGASISTSPSTYDNRLANGTYYELIVYNKAISNAERVQLLSYLAKKWRLNVLPNAFPGTNPYLFVPTYFKRFTPIDIQSCVLWIDAADTTTISGTASSVTGIRDKSASGVQFTTQGTSTFLTLVNQINGNQTLYFNNTGANNVRLQGTFSNLTSGSFFVVWQAATQLSAVFRPLFSWQSTGGLNLPAFGYVNSLTTVAPYTTNIGAGTPTNTVAAGTNYLTFYSWTGTTTNVGFNGATPTAGTQNAYASSATTFTLMAEIASSTLTTAGYIGEMIFYNTVLSSSERQRVEGYLAWKWGTPTNIVLPTFPTHPYSLPRYPNAPKFLPTDFTNCVFWVDGSDRQSIELSSGNKVLSLFDKSTNGYVLTDSNGFDYDTTTSRFSSSLTTTYVLGRNASVSITTPFTVFWVAQSFVALGGSQYFLFQSTAVAGGNIFQDTTAFYRTNQLTTSVPGVTQGVFSTTFASTGVTPDFWVNGISQSVTSAAGSTFTTAGITLGNISGGSASWAGTISEVVILTNITERQRVQMEGYLAWKWGFVNLLASNHPYKDIIP